MKKLGRLFSVYIDPKTYLILIYHLLAFPLGLIYFVCLVTGFSIGFGLTLIIVGLLILMLTLILVNFFTTVERKLAVWLLRIPDFQQDTSRFVQGERSIAKNFFRYILSFRAWTGLFYLMLKLPIGIVTFSIVVFLLVSSLSLLASPLTYHFWQNHFWGPGILFWKIDTLGEGIIGFLLGIALLTVSLNVTNFLGWLVGVFTQWMLNPRLPKPAQSQNYLKPS